VVAEAGVTVVFPRYLDRVMIVDRVEYDRSMMNVSSPSIRQPTSVNQADARRNRLIFRIEKHLINEPHVSIDALVLSWLLTIDLLRTYDAFLNRAYHDRHVFLDPRWEIEFHMCEK